MRYVTLIVTVAFAMLGVLFAMHNPMDVVVRLGVETMNFQLFSVKMPLWAPIVLAFLLGMLFTTFFLMAYHTQIRIRLKMQQSEIFRLKKIALVEREKTKNLQKQLAPPAKPQQPSLPEVEEPSPTNPPQDAVAASANATSSDSKGPQASA